MKFKIRKPKFQPIRIIAFFLTIIIMAFIFFRATTPQSSAGWFDDMYIYRQRVTFTHNASITTPRAVTFSLDTAELITAHLMASDCRDIRFTDLNGLVLRFQQTGSCNNAATTYEVEFPTIANGTNEFYIYYDNGAASAGSDSTVSSVTALTPSGGDPTSTAPTANDEETQGPLSAWTFDEIGSTTVSDYNPGQVHNLPITGATWSGPEKCVFNSCLSFDGNADRAGTTYPSAYGLQPGTGSFTISSWFKHNSTAGADTLAAHIDGVNGIGWKLYMDSSGFMCFGIDAVAGSFPSDSACSTTSYADSQWHHIVGVKSGTSSITLYIDGVQIAQDASITASSLDGSTPVINFGNDYDNGTNGWVGFIDTSKYYNVAKTAAQIKNEYQARNRSEGVSASFGYTNPISALSNGLIGYWTLEDTSDSSGNGYTLTNNNTTTFTSGRFGNGSLHNGTNKYLSTATSISGIKTVAFWVYPASNSDDYINITGSIYINSSSGTVAATGFTSPNIYVNGQLSGTLVASAWNHVVVSSSTSVTATAFEIGRANSAYLNNTGIMDDVRLYNRDLSGQDAQNLYNWSPSPVGWWKYDDGNATTALDSSGGSNNGTLTGGPIWTTGKYGSAVQFDGTNDYVTVADPANGSLDFGTSSYSIGFWFYSPSTISNLPRLISKGYNGSTDGYRIQLYGSGTNQIAFGIGAGGVDANSVAANISYTSGDAKWHHFEGVVDHTTNLVTVYLDGVAQTLTKEAGTCGTVSAAGETMDISSCTSATASSALPFDIGYNPETGGEEFTGSIDEVRVYNYPRSRKEIIQDMNGGHPSGGSPIASQVIDYKMDEQNGTTLNNSNPSQPTLTSTLSNGPLWLPTSSCKINTCLDFDGTDDVATTTNAAPIDLDDNLATGLTVSTWFYADTAGEGSLGQIFQKGTNTWCRTKNLSGGRLDIECSLDLATSDATLTISSAVTTGSWNHLAVAYTDDADDEITIWINGKRMGSSTNGSGAPATDTSNLLIGGVSTANFDGRIDSFKIYTSELSDAEVLIDANAGSAASFGVFATQNDEGFSLPTPAALWKLDDNKGTTTTDSSGNSFTSSTFTGTPVWSPGKIGSGLYFDGTNSVVRIPEATATDKGALSDSYTVSAWFKTPVSFNYTAQANLVAKNNNGTSAYPYELFVDNTEIVCFDMAGTGAPVACTSATYNDGKWHFAVGVRDTTADKLYIYIDGVLQSSATDTTTATAVNNADISIGNGGNSYTQYDFTGSIDNARIYNSALTQAQISYLYNRGAPIAWYKFDECSGATGNNAVSNANGNPAGMNATINIGATGTYTSVGACNTSTSTESWNGGTSGKYSSALALDGTNDYADVSDNSVLRFDSSTQDFSVFAWVKRAANGTMNVLSKEDAANDGWRLQYNVSNQVICSLNSTTITSSSTITDTNWHHIGCTVSRSGNGQVYIDGLPDGSTTSTSSITMATTAVLRLGAQSYSITNYLNGLLDDVRIYNYALTATQVEVVYNQGAAAKFASVTGTP